MKHTVATQSEFSPNELEIDTVAGKLYFIHQYIKLGVFVGGANLELVEEPAGRGYVSGLELAQPGPCPTTYVPSKPAAAAAASAPASSAH